MDREEILKLAEDSKLKLTEDEIEKFQEEFGLIKEKYNILEQFDTEGLEPLFSVLENKISNRFNKDEEVKISEETHKLILDKTRMVEDFYQVPNKEGN